jgi:hypothetical protein
MVMPVRLILTLTAVLSGVLTSFSVLSEEVFDRLDGTGPSGKKVDVVEWDGNLEVHVYPKGSLKGLSAKLDDRQKGKKVMVIGYRFGAKERPLVRRAILGVPFDPKIQAFIEPGAKGYDKIGLSNRPLPAPWKPYKLDPAPAQWYPDGDERNDEDPAAPALTEAPRPRVKRIPAGDRKPLSEGSVNGFNF